MTNGRTVKAQKWIYKELVYSQDGIPMTLTLAFDENEKLYSWKIE